MRGVARYSWQVVEAEVVLRGRVLAPPRFQQARHVRVAVAPEPGWGGRRLGVLRQRLARVRVRHRQVAGQDVVEGRYVGRALDRGVPAERHDAAAGTADV